MVRWLEHEYGSPLVIECKAGKPIRIPKSAEIKKSRYIVVTDVLACQLFAKYSKVFENIPKIAIVRNPCTRFASAYAHFERETNMPSMESLLCGRGRMHRIKPMLSNLCSIYNNQHVHLWSRQYDFLYRHKKPLYTSLLRFEELDRIHQLCIPGATLPDIEFPHPNKKPEILGESHLSENCRLQIAKIFYIDYKYFNYKPKLEHNS